MLDIKLVRDNPDLVDKACESRQNAHWDRARFFELDEERRSAIAEVESLQADRNTASKAIGQLMDKFDDVRLVARFESAGDVREVYVGNEGQGGFFVREEVTGPSAVLVYDERRHGRECR